MVVSSGREYPDKPIVAVGVLIKNGDKVLLAKRRFNPCSGKWSIPGGVVKLGENVREAALREVYEETGLRVELNKLLDVVDYIEKDSCGRIRFHYVLVDFLAHLKGSQKVKPSEEFTDVMWVKVSEILNCDITDSLKMLMTRIRL